MDKLVEKSVPNAWKKLGGSSESLFAQTSNMFEKIQQDAKKRYEKSTSVIMNRTIQTGVDKIYKAAYPTVESRVQRQLSELSGRLEKTFGNGNLSYKSVKDPKDTKHTKHTKHTWEAIIVETITIGAFIATLVFWEIQLRWPFFGEH